MNIVTVIIIIIFADQGQVKIHGRKTLLKWSVRPSARAFLVKRKLENTVNSKKSQIGKADRWAPVAKIYGLGPWTAAYQLRKPNQ